MLEYERSANLHRFVIASSPPGWARDSTVTAVTPMPGQSDKKSLTVVDKLQLKKTFPFKQFIN